LAYPFRIQRPATIVAQGGQAGSSLQQYTARLVQLIPAEVVAAYSAIRGIVVVVAPADALAKETLPWLPLLGLAGVLFVRAWGTRAPSGSLSTIQWAAVGISAVSFIVWVISLGHPIFVQTPIPTWIGSVLLIIWAFLMPYIYKGS
jgi:hypothetical protein